MESRKKPFSIDADGSEADSPGILRLWENVYKFFPTPDSPVRVNSSKPRKPGLTTGEEAGVGICIVLAKRSVTRAIVAVI